MENNNLKISVVTVSYNAVKTIEETILSVIDQAYDNIEYIIIDGGSTDGTIDIIKKYAKGGSEYGKHNHYISYWVSEPDNGIYDAMNKGIEAITGNFVNFMNAGDIFVDHNVVRKVVKYIGGKNCLNIFYGDVIYKYNYGNVYVRAKEPNEINKRLPYCHQGAFSNVTYHKQHHYDTSLRYCADYKFAYQAVMNDRLELCHMPIPIAIYEAEEGLSSANIKKTYKELCLVRQENNNSNNKIKNAVKLSFIVMKDKIRRNLPKSISKKIQTIRRK